MALTIYNMDAMDYLDGCGKRKCIFMDPPDNLGLEYADAGVLRPSDKVPPLAYYGWLESLILRAMLKADIVWLSYYHKHDLAVSRIIYNVLTQRHPSWVWQRVIWRFTFGQYCDNKLSNGHRPMIVLSAPRSTFHYDRIREPSSRMEIYHDPRAAGPRIPDDVWEFPRVVGNARERRSWHPTQHPEALMRRIMLMCGQPFTDLFGGSGTALRVARGTSMTDVHSVELSPTYCKHQSTENNVPIATVF
jgi:DNA methylase